MKILIKIYKIMKDTTGLIINQLRIAYLNNPDVVLVNKLDKIIQNLFSQEGATVIPFQLSEISIKMEKNGIKFYLTDSKEEFQFDAFLSYGYMSKFKDTAFTYLLTAIEKANKFVFHTTANLGVMNNKLLQAFIYSTGDINIPKTYTGFSISAVSDIMSMHFPNDESAINKNLVDYGADGVKLCKYNQNSINLYAREFWRNEYTLFQKFIPDNPGRSIRVVVLGGKAILLLEYHDQTSDFRSNCSFQDIILRNLEDSEKKNEYNEMAEKMVKSIGDIMLCGVDLLDSKQHGLTALEINAYPDPEDILQQIGKNILIPFAKHYCEKALEFKKQNQSN